VDELKRPDIPQKVSSRVNYLWKQSCGGVDDDNVKMRCEDIEKLLFPSEEGLNRVVWNTTRQDERRVRLPLCYNNILTGLASYVPKLHDFSWKVKEVLGNTDDKYLDIYKGFGDTLTLLVKNELREINWKDLLEDFVLRSLVFPASVLKVTYMSKYVGSTDIQGKRSIEDQIARLVVKIRDAKLGINSDDKLNQEIIELESAISQESELLKWDGINIENVPLENWRYDRSVWSLENLHLCGWQSHDIRMRVDVIKQRFLFSLLPQANEIGMEFEGIHPVDIGKITHDANDIVLVRELWSRDDNRVYILVDGVDYPVRTFVPQKTTSQWYPFYVFVNNRIPNDVIGVSDIELQKEMQTRINRKLSDDEKFRWLSLPRFVYDKTSISNCELKELLNTNPGELIGVELLNRESNLGNLIMPLQYQYSPYAVDVSRDEQYLRRFSYIPQQVQ
jgi:hypothetical protein